MVRSASRLEELRRVFGPLCTRAGGSLVSVHRCGDVVRLSFEERYTCFLSISHAEVLTALIWRAVGRRRHDCVYLVRCGGPTGEARLVLSVFPDRENSAFVGGLCATPTVLDCLGDALHDATVSYEPAVLPHVTHATGMQCGPFTNADGSERPPTPPVDGPWVWLPCMFRRNTVEVITRRVRGRSVRVVRVKWRVPGGHVRVIARRSVDSIRRAVRDASEFSREYICAYAAAVM